MSTPLDHLRAKMASRGVHAILVPTADFHDSDHAGPYFACRAWLSGFTGSAGTLLILADWAGLWTDSRYYLQAEVQLSDTGITLMKSGLPDTPTLESMLETSLKEGQTLACDGRCVSSHRAEDLRKRLTPLGITLRCDLDLVGDVWIDRPPRSAQPLWELDCRWTGVSRAEKLAFIRADMERLGADHFLLATLEDIAWLLNVRGNDLPHTPVFFSYLLLTTAGGTLFVTPEAVSPSIKAALEAEGLAVASYDSIYHHVANLPALSRVLTDRRRTSCRLLEAIPATASIIDRPSPTEKRKAVKNPVEIRNIRAAHVKDGVTLTRFLCWLKISSAPSVATELSVTDHLESLRQEQEGYLSPSFPPIVAYGPNGAIVHYSATEKSNQPLQAKSFLLVDTGGHYWEGTTDCTRTVALGPLSQKEKVHYTTVLRGHLNLTAARFKAGCTGSNLDYLAKAPLWAEGLDYGHGTGHGVGYLLNVHEGPVSIHLRNTPDEPPLEAGMVISNEPGLYLEGQYGIRLENLLLCIPQGESVYGTFLGFEPLTLVPFDLDAVDPTLLTPHETKLLNGYHQTVRETLSPYLSPSERVWLEQATHPI
ncbi:MAG: Xaa-Pro aminopeptidase [Firmicutes bacterium]|nr:Xaa-Pro aminopeptidase [Bacillota bacterium]